MNPMIEWKRIVKPLKTSSLLIPLMASCLALLPKAQAVIPPPDGGYSNFTTAEGANALLHLTSGVGNTALGWSSLFSDTTASYNTGVGAGALALNNADQNTAIGAGALFLNTVGTGNTANGALALLHNDTGQGNTAIGTDALLDNTTGSFSTATGFGALVHNNTNANTANGALALQNNTSGFANTAIGGQALQSNQGGSDNTATGFQALLFNLASDNTGFGYQALSSNTTGSGNMAMGHQALFNNHDGSVNTAIGWNALLQNISGSDNIALGANAGSLITGDHNIVIADSGAAAESGTIRIGNNIHHTRAFIAGIHGVNTSGGTPVYINPSGQLGTATSSARFKEQIHGMDKASEAVLALRPVTFRYKKEMDPAGTAQFGLVAEEVEKVKPDLVLRDKDGRPYTVRYDAVNAMLLNEFLKEHRKVQELERQVEKLAAGLEKLSAQVQLKNPAAQVAANQK